MIRREGFTCLMRATVSGTLSASMVAVLMVTPVRVFTDAAMASHFETVREASVMSVKTSESCAHLWATTEPTPPAPMIRTVDILVLFLVS